MAAIDDARNFDDENQWASTIGGTVRPNDVLYNSMACVVVGYSARAWRIDSGSTCDRSFVPCTHKPGTTTLFDARAHRLHVADAWLHGNGDGNWKHPLFQRTTGNARSRMSSWITHAQKHH